jgi:hypothetical protein
MPTIPKPRFSNTETQHSQSRAPAKSDDTRTLSKEQRAAQDRALEVERSERASNNRRSK